MANEVKIIIDAVDKASKTIRDVGNGFGVLDDELKQIEKTMRGTSTTIGGLGDDITVFGKNLGSAKDAMNAMGISFPTTPMDAFGKAVRATAQYIKESVDVTVRYAESVRRLSNAIGSTPEEASKLIQVADDVEISFEQLYASMRLAIQRGVEPTIIGIGKLSDAYLALQPGIERSKFLLDNFGRSGLELTRLMELGSQKITEMGKSIEGTSYLMTEEGIKAALEFQSQLNALNDQFEMLKITIGTGVIPYLTELFKVLNQPLGGNSWWAGWLAVNPLMTAYVNKVAKSRFETDKAAESQADLADAVEDVSEEVDLAAKDVGKYGDALNTADTIVVDATKNVAKYGNEVKLVSDIVKESGKNVANFGTEMGKASDISVILKDKTEILRESLDFRNLDLGLADTIMSEVEKAEAVLKSPRLLDLMKRWKELQLVDPKNQQDLEKLTNQMKALALQFLIAEHNAGILSDADFAQKLKEQFGIAAREAERYLKDLQDINYELSLLDGSIVTFTIYGQVIYPNGPPVLPSGSGDATTPMPGNWYPWNGSGTTTKTSTTGSVNNNYNLTVVSNAPVEPMIADFTLLKTMAGAM